MTRTFKPRAVRAARWLGATALLAALPAAAHAQAVPDAIPEAEKTFKMALDWADGKLTDYKAPKVTYTGDPITIRVSTHTPLVASITKFNDKAHKVLEKMSNGKLKVEFRGGGVVHNVQEGFEANRNGITDMSPCFVFYNPTNFPLTQALGLPGLFPNGSVQQLVSSRLHRKYFAAEFEKQGVLNGGYYAGSSFNLMGKQPLTKLEDLKGKKIRSGGGINQRIFQALGASTVNMSSRDYQQGLQRGLLDALYVSDAASVIFKIDDVATDRTETNINHQQLEWCFNRRTFEKLPADLKAVLNAWNVAYFQAMTQVEFHLAGVKARDRFKKKGMKFHTIAPDEWKKWEAAYAGVTENYIKDTEAKGLPAKQLIADIKAEVEKLKAKSYGELLAETMANPPKTYPGL